MKKPSAEETRRLIERAGGPANVARMFKPQITSQAVSQWSVVPIGRVLAIEAASDVSRFELRPDVYGPVPAPRARAA